MQLSATFILRLPRAPYKTTLAQKHRTELRDHTKEERVINVSHLGKNDADILTALRLW